MATEVGISVPFGGELVVVYVQGPGLAVAPVVEPLNRLLVGRARHTGNGLDLVLILAPDDVHDEPYQR
eukprot:3992833-Pyramimonas_sp.AAC.1